MEALEFIRTLQKLCTGSKCYDCPLEEKGRCIIIHAVNPEESVRIVEEWAAEQEQQKAEQERQKAEQERQKAEQERQKAEQERQKAEQERQKAEITSGILNEPSAPEFLSAEAMKRVLQDETVLRVIASLTLGPDYERKTEMARKTVEKRLQEDENRE